MSVGVMAAVVDIPKGLQGHACGLATKVKRRLGIGKNVHGQYQTKDPEDNPEFGGKQGNQGD